MKELNEIGRQDLAHNVKLKIATDIRDFKEAARGKVKDNDIKFQVESFNNHDLRKDPDTIGITLCYPNEESPTHVICGTFTKSIGEKSFADQVAELRKKLLAKIKGNQ